MTLIAILMLVVVILIAAYGIAKNAIQYVGTAVIVLTALLIIWVAGGSSIAKF